MQSIISHVDLCVWHQASLIAVMDQDQCNTSSASCEIIAKSCSYECEQSVLSRADGSASFKQGNTEVLAAVYGPGEVRLNKEQIDKATIECIFKPKSGLSGSREKLIERLIRNSCDSVILSSYHPRSAISIIVQTVHDSGYLLSTALNSAFMALVNAGISLKCMVGAVSCFLNQNGEISFEITEDSEQECIAMFTFVFDSLNQDLIMTHTSGNFSEEQYFSCMAASREAVKSVFEFQRKSIERYLSMEK